MTHSVLHRVPAVAPRHLTPAPTRAHAVRPLAPGAVAAVPPLPPGAVAAAPAAPPASALPSAGPLRPGADPDLHVGSPDYGVRTVEFRPGSETGIVLAAARADVIRLGFSAAVPTVPALARVVALVDEALTESGRARSEVRVVLDVEVVLAPDEPTARRKRAYLEHLDALAGLGWLPAATRVVTTADRLAAEVTALAQRAGVDGLVLLPLPAGASAEAALRALL